MKVSIVSVGTEVVLGDQVDANAAWISQRLREIGVEVQYHLAIGDDHQALCAGLRWVVERSDAVIVGGGLGPTPDDLTREAVAEVVGELLETREELEEAILQVFAQRGLRMPSSNLQQARIPRGAKPFLPLGTAPGFQVEVDDTVIYVLPGVPWEYQGMYERDVVPDLLTRVGGGASVTRTIHVSGMGEATVAELVAPIVQDHTSDDDVAVSYLATGQEIQVRVTARAADPTAARERTEPVLAAIRERLGRVVVGVDQESIEEVIGGLLKDADQSVAFAESATAGGVTARMARIPGASGTLKGGIAVYSTETKTRCLGVPEELIEEHSPVSEEVTRELALRVREHFGADWGVAVTGVAGPGTQGGKPVGTVVWAVAAPDGEVTVEAGEFPGDRHAIQERLGSAALELLRRSLENAAG
ncbi:MAG: competence/damage-inducible protein A [Actinobacteria bacterium]|nr:competence/damage-inducible protein A [Actinomycetota bacterium]